MPAFLPTVSGNCERDWAGMETVMFSRLAFGLGDPAAGLPAVGLADAAAAPALPEADGVPAGALEPQADSRMTSGSNVSLSVERRVSWRCVREMVGSTLSMTGWGGLISIKPPRVWIQP